MERVAEENVRIKLTETTSRIMKVSGESESGQETDAGTGRGRAGRKQTGGVRIRLECANNPEALV